MLRPFALDVLEAVAPLLLGGAALLVGTRLRRWRRWICWLTAALVSLVIVGGVAALVLPPPHEVNRWLSFLGGATILLCWAGLLLLGIAWTHPRRTFSTAFLAALAVLAGALIFIESSGRLLWRFVLHAAWDNTVDARGQLRQSSGLTCSPASAAMLLHRYGVRTSEGEMAYAAGTSVLGTDIHAMARAINLKLAPDQGRAVASVASYEACLHATGPFIAHVHVPGIGGHALLVEKIAADRVIVADPLKDRAESMTRADFEAIWRGNIILRIEPPP